MKDDLAAKRSSRCSAPDIADNTLFADNLKRPLGFTSNEKHDAGEVHNYWPVGNRKSS